MSAASEPGRAHSLDEVREAIDALDAELVALLGRRGEWVKRAAAFKADEDAVRDPGRVEEVVLRARARAAEVGADPDVVEDTFRAMIAAFVDAEIEHHGAPEQG